MASLSTILPSGLNNPADLPKVRKAVKQWSQLVAWSWSPSLAFAGDTAKAAEEQTLKDFFKSIMNLQAKNLSAATSYGDPDAGTTAQVAAENIKKLFAGNNAGIGEIAAVQLTLTEVLKKLTDEDFVFGMDANFRDRFRFEVIVDEFSGRIRDDEAAQGHYVASLTYPPRPALGPEFDGQLENWMNASSGGDYLPPSAYIPLSGS